ncbi:asparagine synthetase [Tulasnella sp. 403]|nr:asparagine synthetase [Tulasnella sp. 403]
MEKYILRKAFDIDEGRKAYLPSSILFRQKEQFSDGVGYSWIDGIKDHATHVVSDEAFAKRHETYPMETPDTKEGYFIRETFESESPPDFVLPTRFVRFIQMSLTANRLLIQ